MNLNRKRLVEKYQGHRKKEGVCFGERGEESTGTTGEVREGMQ